MWHQSILVERPPASGSHHATDKHHYTMAHSAMSIHSAPLLSHNSGSIYEQAVVKPVPSQGSGQALSLWKGRPQDCFPGIPHRPASSSFLSPFFVFPPARGQALPGRFLPTFGFLCQHGGVEKRLIMVKLPRHRDIEKTESQWAVGSRTNKPNSRCLKCRRTLESLWAPLREV